jgi:hypothetical protein
MEVSRALCGITTDAENSYLKAGFLSLPGLYEALSGPLAQHNLALSTAVFYSVEAGMFVVRTKLSAIDTGESDHSDFPIGSIAKRDDIGSSLTYGTRYNIFALLAFAPDKDGGGSDSSPGSAQAAQGGWQLPGQAASPQLPPAQPWALPGQAAPQPEPQQQPWGQPPAAQYPAQPPQQAWAAQTGTQRTEPMALPTQPPHFAPQVLSNDLPY